MKVLIALIALSLSAFAQTPSLNSFLGNLVDTNELASTITVAGVGVDNSNGGIVHYNTATCHLTDATTYGCLESRISGTTSSNTVTVRQVLFARSGWVLTGKVGAGLATGTQGSAGAAYLGGGSLSYRVGKLKLLAKYPGTFMGIDAGWDKRNVDVLRDGFSSKATLGAAIRRFSTSVDGSLFVGFRW